MDKKQEELMEAISRNEEAKREFVMANPHHTGDREERLRLYAEVEKARRALREYKRLNPHLYF